MASEPPILIIEDDAHTVALVSSVLEESGYAVSAADTVSKGRELLQKAPPCLLILDRNLPDADGLQLATEIRGISQFKNLPVLFLTARKSVSDKVAGLKVADDYLSKPFSPVELLARVQAILRRWAPPEEKPTLEAGKIRLDMRARKAFLQNQEIDLWAKEFDLLSLFLSQRNRVLTRELMLQQVWGYEVGSQPNTKAVDVTISHLRAKLGSYGDKIVSVRGFGYRFEP